MVVQVFLENTNPAWSAVEIPKEPQKVFVPGGELIQAYSCDVRSPVPSNVASLGSCVAIAAYGHKDMVVSNIQTIYFGPTGSGELGEGSRGRHQDLGTMWLSGDEANAGRWPGILGIGGSEEDVPLFTAEPGFHLGMLGFRAGVLVEEQELWGPGGNMVKVVV